EAERFNKLAMIDKGKMLAYDTPAQIKTIMNQEIIEVVCNPVRKAYRLLNEVDVYEVQIFGDRLNVSSEYEKINVENIQKILKENSIQISDIRKIPPSLENAFIHLIKENN
ncbi:MAG: ABC transporter ATP-binding protein, partial [Ignavibacteria bacterium]